MGEARHVVALSGGKDSTAMALLLRDQYPSRKFEYVITPTGDELPEMEDHWRKLESMLGGLKKIGTETIFDVIARKKMLPNFRARFCTTELKVKPFIQYMAGRPDDSTMYVGLRADEPGRLGIIDTEIAIEYPLRDAKFGIRDVIGYLKHKEIEIPERTDCGMCPMQRLPEWASLLERHPDRYENYVQMEKKYGHTLRSPHRDTWPADLDGLRKDILSGRKMRKTSPRGSKRCRFCSM